jgi:hypothetical protein
MPEERVADDQHQISRRTLLAAAAALAVPAAVYGDSVNQGATKEARMPDTTSTWPHGARLAVSFSLMFEAGGQPISGAGGVIPDPIQQGLPDLPTNAFFEYGVYEGIPRILDLFDKHKIKMSSFMIGHAVDKAPDLASLGLQMPAMQVVLAGSVELITAIGLVLGLFTRPVAVLGSVYLLLSMLWGGHFQIGYVWAFAGRGLRIRRVLGRDDRRVRGDRRRTALGRPCHTAKRFSKPLAAAPCGAPSVRLVACVDPQRN